MINPHLEPLDLQGELIILIILLNKCSQSYESVASVASVPVRSEQNSGRAKGSFGPREK